MAWKTFNQGSGPVAPVFPQSIRRVAGIPMNGKGNIYSPNTPKGIGYKANGVVRPGDSTLTGSGGRLKFG
jgi:hypothetical protein